MSQTCNLPLVVEIKRHSLEDGPGIRSVVFFKGCPLRCVFCHSPETQDPRIEIAFSPNECIRCRRCMDICPEKAIDFEIPGRIHRKMCTRCGKCADVCPGKGIRSIGSYYPVDTLIEILLRDLPFYRHSNGGVTLSGGECTLYPDYLEAVLKGLKSHSIHLAVQTSGYFSYNVFKKKILPYINLIYFDVKVANQDIHKKYTGKPNRIIFSNLQRLIKETQVEVHPRIPLIPGFTATKENLSSIADILIKFRAKNVSLLPYNPLGIEIAWKLGKPKPDIHNEFMKPDDEKRTYELFNRLIAKKIKQKIL